MKILKVSLLSLLSLVVLIVLAIFIYLQSLKPQYSGQASIGSLQAETTVHFDTYGVPHIYAENEPDAFRVLGYLHAQERLFQMEMIRRVASGRLSEVLGKEMLDVDKFFRTLGIQKVAQASVIQMMEEADSAYVKAAKAYLEGINEYIKKGKTPIEFSLIGIPKDTFTMEDTYMIAGYMSFGFAEGFKIDPMLTSVKQKLGDQYLKDWAIDWTNGAAKIPVTGMDSGKVASSLAYNHHDIISKIPTATWIGSNGWVVSGNKSASGGVILENDTHMGHSAPGIWYEAHIETPDWGFYGNFVAGFPFAMVGHSRFSGWGLTMFENDDVDFFFEKSNPNDSTQIWVNGAWEKLSYRQETINIKGGETETITIRESTHGPIISDIHEDVKQLSKEPISVWWAFVQQNSRDLKAVYGLAHSKSLVEARHYVSLIYAPGLNVMYGNARGDIAWWATARLPMRPSHVQSKLFLDGSSGKDEYQGFLEFNQNPMSENPTSQFVYSANNQPDSIKGGLYPGYYVPENRAKRISELLAQENAWTVDKMKTMAFDNHGLVDLALAQHLLGVLAKERLDKLETESLAMLTNWKGEYETVAIGPTIYNKWLAFIFELSHRDELGELYDAFVSTHTMKCTIAPFIQNDSSIWWDNIETPDIRETRSDIVFNAYQAAIAQLRKEYGDAPETWAWGNAHVLEYKHLVGDKKPLDRIFNLGPFALSGGNEVINNQGFKLSTEGKHTTSFGPAMRRIIDFSDPENSYSVLPSGQSGYFMSKHYNDQVALYIQGQFRKQLMNKEEIEATAGSTLIFKKVTD